MPARKKTQPTNQAGETDDTASALKQTLLNAEQGLQSFLASLQNSGLPEAAGGYRQLQALLLQQRLWAVNHQRVELNEHFTRIARLAGELQQIFQSYADLLKPLCELDKLTAIKTDSVPSPASPPTGRRDAKP